MHWHKDSCGCCAVNLRIPHLLCDPYFTIFHHKDHWPQPWPRDLWLWPWSWRLWSADSDSVRNSSTICFSWSTVSNSSCGRLAATGTANGVIHGIQSRGHHMSGWMKATFSRCKKKGKEADLYSAFIEVPYTQGAQVWITQCYLQITPYLPLPRKHHQMAHPRLRLRTSNCSLLLIYLPRKDERLSWPGWLVT